MKGIILEFNQTGNSVLDVDFVCKKWNDQFGISSWTNSDEEKYTLFINGKRKNTRLLKSQISKEQAFEIIKKLELVKIKDSTFRSASLFVKRSFAISERDRFLEIATEKQRELNVIFGVLRSYENAL